MTAEQTHDDRKFPFFQVENALIDDYGAQIGPYGIAVYVCIVRHVNQKSGVAWPSMETIAQETGMKRNRVWKSIKQLRELGLLETASRNPESGWRTSLEYRLPNVGVVSQEYSSCIPQIQPVVSQEYNAMYPTDTTRCISQIQEQYEYNNTNLNKTEKIPAAGAAAAEAGPALPTLPGIDLTQSIPAILDALAHQSRDVWEQTLFAEQHKPSGKPRKGLITAIQDELSPVRKLTQDETEQALALAQVIAECAYGFRKPVVGSTKSLIMGNVKKIILDLTEMGETTPEPDEMRRAYSKYTADGTKAPRDVAKIIGMLMEVRNGGTKQEPTPQFRGTYSRYNGTPDTWPKPIVLDEQEYLADHADLEADDESERVSDLRGRGLVHRGVPGRVERDDELPGLPGREGTGNGSGAAPAGHLQPAGVAAR